MTSVLFLLHDVQEIEVIPIEFPNMSKTLAIKKGIVYLKLKLILNSILFILRLNCNLISIVQLIDDKICKLTFTKRLCMI